MRAAKDGPSSTSSVSPIGVSKSQTFSFSGRSLLDGTASAHLTKGPSKVVVAQGKPLGFMLCGQRVADTSSKAGSQQIGQKIHGNGTLQAMGGVPDRMGYKSRMTIVR